jgi:SAM-dependent methyltransferase
MMSFVVKTVVPMKQRAAFRSFMNELTLSMHLLGIELEAKAGGYLWKGGKEAGRVAKWQPWKNATILFRYPEWEQSDTTVDLAFQPINRGTRVIIEYSGLESLLLRGEGEPLGWFASQVVAPFLTASTPSEFGDWLTDRGARRPAGAAARRGYRNPTYHRPNFGAILEELSLTPKDRLLEIGCGGGALLHDALKRGCTAAGIDHSPEMVRLARRANARAIKEGRLEIKESSANSIPFGDSAFTCAAMTSVIGFLEDPVRVFREVVRTLVPGGKMVVFSTSKEAKGTIAAPEPMASRLHFYEDEELLRMASDAGFEKARVERPDLSRFVKGSGIPKSDELSFSTPNGQLLIAKKASR